IADGLPRSEKRREIGLLDQNAVMNVIDGAEERLPRTGRANVPQADTAEAGVGRVVLLSFLDPTRFEGEPAGEQRFHRTIRGDRRLMECPLAWSIIRPGEIVTQGHGSGRIDASTDLKSWREIEAGDGARTAVHALLTGDADRKSIEITGGQTPMPEAVRTAEAGPAPTRQRAGTSTRARSGPRRRVLSYRPSRNRRSTSAGPIASSSRRTSSSSSSKVRISGGGWSSTGPVACPSRSDPSPETVITQRPSPSER